MTATRIGRARTQTTVDAVQDGRRMRHVLVGCGIMYALLYIATDVLAGLRYEGYDFASRAISELSAIGAPTRSLVLGLGLVQTVLLIAFGIGVWRSAAESRPRRVVGALLVGSAIVGLAWPFAPMHQRGTLFTLTDKMHIVLAAVTVLLFTLPIIAFGAAAMGRRFRLYSIATFAVVVVFGVLAGLDGPRVAADLPTPRLGVTERISVHAYTIWLAVLAIALLRRPSWRARSAGVRGAHIDGMVAPGFEEVRVEFERNFAERGEIGAAVAAYWRGEKVVDLWGGRRNADSNEPWKEDTMVVVMSSTKGLAAMAVAVANSRGWLDYDAPVARYWPEFAQNGKQDVSVRQLIGHEAGVAFFDEDLTIEKLQNLDYMAQMLARQVPAWPPGTRHGYHAMTIGFYLQELIRRVDPAHRTIGRFFHEEIATPLGIEFYIGLPADIPDKRLAGVKTLSPMRGLKALRYTQPAVALKMLSPRSLLRKSFAGLNLDWNDRRSYAVEVPAGNGVGTARAIARAYYVFAEGGAELGITPKTFLRIIEPPGVAVPKDAVIGIPSYFSLGFMRPGPEVLFGSSPRAFGSPGAGGSLGFADPDVHLGYAYVMNKLDFYLVDDPREKALRAAVYRAMGRVGSRAPARREREGEVLPVESHHTS